MIEKLLPFPELETDRLLLRKIGRADAGDIFAATGDAEVSKYMNWQPYESAAMAVETIDMFCREYETGDNFQWGIALKDGNRLIGMIFLKPVFAHNRVEVGYWIGRSYRGREYTTEALQAIVHLCFTEFGVNRIEANYRIENGASAAEMEKAGMQPEGILRQYYLGKDGQYHDCQVYSIVRNEYFHQQE